MRILHALALASGLAVAAAAFPVMAQQDQQQAPMMGPGGQGGTMGPGGQGGTMGPGGQGGMMGPGGQGGMMGPGGQGGMMGPGGQGGMGPGGMMDRGGTMGHDMAGQDLGGCPMMGDMMGFGRRGMKQGMGHSAMMHSVPMMEGRLAYIKADLEITDAQTPAWDAYAGAVRAQHATMETMHADMMKAKESGGVLERMDARIKTMESKVAGLKALKPVTEALYTQLTDEQKKKADQLLGGRCGMM